MKFLYKMERKYGKYAISNLSMYIAICFGLSYMLSLLLPELYMLLTFSPAHIFIKHQYWRLFTWILTTPGGFDIFSFIMIFFYFSIGTSIERGIGTFMYNLYVLGCLLLITVSQFVTWLVVYLTNGELEFLFKASALDGAGGGSLMTYYMTTSVFLGYALLYSEAIVLLFFVIPFKVKWMAYIDAFYLLYYFVRFEGITSRVTILAIAVNFLIYYYILRKASGRRHATAAQLKHRRMFRTTMRAKEAEESKVIDFNTGKASNRTTPSSITRHRCALCGRTERDGADIEFRFCSKCNGNYEYCMDHLYTHEHIK